MPQSFYWRNARDSLITPIAVQLFQIIARYDGKEFDTVKDSIDHEYASLTGAESARHGGKIQTAKEVYREAGWLDLSPNAKGKPLIRITEVGKQALLMLGMLPDFLKAVPYFVVELLTRYQLNNPARPTSRSPEYDDQLQDATVFPYWTLFRIMRDCRDSITSEELKRFVFRIKRTEDIPGVVKQINEFRRDKESDFPKGQLDKYPPPLEGAIADTKYLMGRLGTQVGRFPPVIYKERQETWHLHEAYIPFIDQILSHEPIFKEYVDESTWMREYGRPIPLTLEEPGDIDYFADKDGKDEEQLDLPDDDPIWKATKSLLDSGFLTVVLSGPPGTSKTWYARRIAHKLAGHSSRVKQLQFHPSFSYDDFVESYVPAMGAEGSSSAALFRIVPKIFLSLCNEARRQSDQNFVLVIDEINRGDVSRIFGELLTYLETSYRKLPFTLAYSGKRTSIPGNVILIGTMNPFDRSITELDDAFERRFARIALNPDIRLLTKICRDGGTEPSLISKIVTFFNKANELAPHGFGHAFFIGVRNEQDLIKLWNHNVRFVFEKMLRFDHDKFQEIRDSYATLVTDANSLT